MTIKIGIDYYPEQWTPELWEKDAILMQQTGVAVVRMAEFAWSRMEPTEGNYQFEWLDAAIEVFRFARHGNCVMHPHQYPAKLDDNPLSGCAAHG